MLYCGPTVNRVIRPFGSMACDEVDSLRKFELCEETGDDNYSRRYRNFELSLRQNRSKTVAQESKVKYYSEGLGRY